ncbi:MAG TPA: metal-dependent hydrolase [Thermoanaerobaculia bacterium]|jgi:L-ascorbate metabolism protein UlaG (beta-lactamase superfamily)|nr:metal-dependent hydrolase [Thermoanaerobaculia bacterium]
MHTPRPKFTYLGHATVRCDLPDGEVLLIDPWVQGNPACPEKHKRFERLDAMLLTHAHFDHIGDAVTLAKEHRPRKVVGCFELCTWLGKKGVENTAPMNLGGSQQVLGARVTMVRADHSCGITEGDQVLYGGVASGYVVRLASGFTFYHSGDTALFTDMQLLCELYRPELAFLPIGDLFTMDPHQAARACRYLGVQVVIPIHWGTFDALTGKPEHLESELAKEGSSCQVVTLRPGESY